MAAFELQQQSFTVVTDAIWPANPKIFTIWTLTGKSVHS